MKKRIATLKTHPAQATIYHVEPEDVESLAENIKKLGQLEPAIVSKDGTLLSGYTRCEALKLLGRKTIEVRVVDVPPEEQVFYLISANKHRIKSYGCRVAEIEALKQYYSKGPGFRADLEEGTPAPAGSRRMTTRQRIALDLGISQDTISKLTYINRHRPDLLPYIGKSITLVSAYAQIRLWLNQSKILKENKRKRKKSSYKGKGFVIYNKSAINMDELEDNSVTGAIVTSPPYFQQRVFTADGTVKTSKNGTPELGQELEVNDYVENLCVILAECSRVLSPTASFYLNLGDTYQEGNLLNVPARVSIAVQDKLGLILKQTLIWWKSGSIMPESTKRRRMNDFEFIYHFVKDRKQYYYDADQIREPYQSQEPVDRKAPRHYDELEEGVNWRWVNIAKDGDVDGMLRTTSNVGSSVRHAGGKIPGAVMEISRHCPNLEEFGIAHTAGFPAKLVDELLKPVLQEGDVVLDPFSGSGTVGVVALEHGCEYVGYEINNQFAELGMRRIKKSCLPAYQNGKHGKQVSKAS